MTDRELMQQALEALESAKYGMAECRQEIGFDFANEQYDVEQAITALRERLAQADFEQTYDQMMRDVHAKVTGTEQEPVAWFDKEFNSVRWRANLRNCDLADQQPLYTAPPRRELVLECPHCGSDQSSINRTCARCGKFTEALAQNDVRREWVGLTEAQAGAMWKKDMTPYEFARAIEAKLKEKNA